MKTVRIFFAALIGFFFAINVMQSQPLQGKWINGKKFTTYKVQAKDTWTRLASKYEIDIKELQKANEGVKDLKIGQIINVPSPGEKKIVPPNIPDHLVTKVQHGSPNATYHEVKAGETLYRISRLYNQSVADIKKWNNLTSDNVSVGRKLMVSKPGTISKNITEISKEPKIENEQAKHPEQKPSLPAPSTPVVVEKEKKSEPEERKPVIADKKVEPVSNENKPDQSVADKITESGIATWVSDQELNQNKFYALHRTAPVGTIIKVTNKMNNNSVFVKVVGALPDTGDNDNVIIKITQASAQRIGAIDQKFAAVLSYGVSH